MINARWRSALYLCALVGSNGCTSINDLEVDLFAASNVRRLSDGEAISIATTLHSAEISAARMVEGRLMNLKVKGFARQMIDSHSLASARMRDLSEATINSRSENAVTISLRDLSWVAERRLAAEQSLHIDNTYLLSEITAQARALTVINCALISPDRDEELGVLLDQMRVNLKRDLIIAVGLRQDLNLPDNGEADVVGCLAVCASEKANATAPSLPVGLKSTLCL